MSLAYGLFRFIDKSSLICSPRIRKLLLLVRRQLSYMEPLNALFSVLQLGFRRSAVPEIPNRALILGTKAPVKALAPPSLKKPKRHYPNDGNPNN